MTQKKSLELLKATLAKQSFLQWLKTMQKELPGYIGPIFGFSVAVNILMMVSPLYMLQVYDRVLTSGSFDTLIWLTVISVFLLGIYAAAEFARRRISTLAAEELEEKISERIFTEFETAEDGGRKLQSRLMLVGRIRALYHNQTILPFCDLPFVPLFIGVLFLVHPLIGTVALVGGIVIFAIAILAEKTNRDANDQAMSVSAHAFELASGLSRQRSAIVAMGLSANALNKWRTTKTQARELSLKASEREGGFTAVSRSARQVLQILILGTGAGLAVSQAISPGAIVAGSIILSRALAPIDQIVGSWRAIAQARHAWNQLQSAISMKDEEEEFTPLPRPAPVLTLDRLSVRAPGVESALIRPFTLKVEDGQMFTIAGENGAGKTTMLQTLAGVWSPSSGSVSLGGRSIHNWNSADRGQYVGYMPQNVELLPGSIAENISRMSETTPEKIIAAAQQAGAHEMILSLPKAYETQIGGANGLSLSAGQRQMIGLARALFGNPVLLLLDEPTANLDPAASAAVVETLRNAAARGTLVFCVTHDQQLVQASETVLLIKNGAVLSAQSSKYLNVASAASNVQPITSGASA